jgi:hypothetical protein
MDYEDEAAKISAEIDLWQSPRFEHTGRPGRRSFEEDTNRYLMEEDTNDRHVSFTPAPATPALSLLKRMGTPAASNNLDLNWTEDDKMEDDDDYVPHDVQSPWVSRSVKDATPIIRRSNPSFQSSHTDYKRYYDASLTYLRDRRRLSERMALQNEKAELLQDAMIIVDENEGSDSQVDQKLIKDETQVELDFLRALNYACWDRSTNAVDDSFRKEGNFWLLLYFLRQQGTTSLLWDDSQSALHSYNNIISSYLESQASFIKRSDKELLDVLYCNGTGCPLVLKRRQRILTWLEKCFEDVLPDDATRPRKTKYIINAKLTREGLPETDKDAEILKNALGLILSGRLADAKSLARDSGIPWRAAVWGGGAPEDGASTGNPRRFLWKRMMWIQAEKLSEQKGGLAEEIAISALLSSNLSVALSNASCRTWQHGLYATIRAMLDRTEDDLLHLRNNNRRRMIPYFPVAEHEKVESAYLRSTTEVAGWNETDAIHILKTAPFECMQGTGIIERAIASFVIGRESISQFMSEAMSKVVDDSSLRFLTHIALYLDSFSSSINQASLVGSTEWKNELLSRYVEHLASREDLWYMIVLYASLLPDTFIFETLPMYLTSIESPQEREVVVRQLRELLPGNDWDSDVLKRVVSIIFEEEDESVDPKNVTPNDYLKMKAVDWLNFDDRHCGEALVAANRLLRQFLLADKTISANTFINDVSLDILDNVSKYVEILEAIEVTAVDQEVKRLRMKQAHSEFIAFKAYFNALNAYNQWNYVKTTSPTTTPVSTNTFDGSRLNSRELEIARREKHRQLIVQKRDISGNVVSAANAAQSALREVLEHPGGWLVTEDEVVLENDADTKRLLELGTLRSNLIPGIIKLYQSVCSSTAEWMAESLDDLTLQLEQKRQTALQILDETSAGLDSAVSPKYWANRGIELLNIVSSEKDKIESVLGPDDLKSIMETTCQLAILEMQY